MIVEKFVERVKESSRRLLYQKRSYDPDKHTYRKGASNQKLRIGIIFCLVLVAVAILCFTPLWMELAKGISPEKTQLQMLQEFRHGLDSKIGDWKHEIYEESMRQGTPPPKPVIDQSARGHIVQEVISRMASLKKSNLKQLQSDPENSKLLKAVVKDLCHETPVCTQEQLSSPYRTLDGSCNNQMHPHWGMAGRHHKRHRSAWYRDGYGAPKTHSFTGEPLPSPRLISNVLHRSTDGKRTDDVTTVMVMAFGQFLSHDVASTPMTDGHHSSVLKCCEGKSSYPFNACFPVQVLSNDTYFRNTSCMSFTRSAPAICNECEICGREQINEMTSYVDASQVYGTSESHAKQLRNYHHGMLLDTGVDYLLPQQDSSACRLSGSDQYCFNAGDRRVNVIPNLSTLHTVFVRLHNHLAISLLRYNPRWDDEKLYQEARRILIAIMQNIVYNEYLPVILGHYNTYSYELAVSNAYSDVYDENVDATVSNVFSTAAFRFGHANIPDTQISLNSEYIPECVSPVEDTYLNPNLTFLYCSGLARWMVHKEGAASDGLFSDGVRNKLFLDKHKSFDLVALNIQRGRDHGLPSYNEWRRFCKLQPITEEQFASKGSSMGDFDTQTAELFRSLYRHQEDIDVYSGGMKERKIQDGQVGPLFACILGTDFRNLKLGDRYYFENPRLETSFTKDQLYTIKEFSFAKVLCKMMNIQQIQPSVFRPPDKYLNTMVSCNELPDIDLRYWASKVNMKTDL